MTGRRVGTLVVALLSALLALGVAAPAASAHAALLRTTPQDAQILDGPPTEATLTFGEDVGIGLGQLKVLSAGGKRVDSGVPYQSAGGSEVHIPLQAGIAQGSYVVIWRVISADSHPVSGAFSFSVGKPSANSSTLLGRGNITSLEAAPRAPSVALGATRFLGFAALTVLLGGAVFCLVLWPTGLPRLRGLLLGAAFVEGVMAVLALFLEGPYAAGDGLSKTFDTTLLRAVEDTHYGVATTTRIGLSVAAFAVLALVGARRGRVVAGVVGSLGLACALTWSAAGHGGVGSWEPLTYVFDATHLLFVSTWVGGLVVLGWGLRRARWSEAEQEAVLPGWSRLATWSVALIVATGVFASFREVNEVDALFTTKYGLLLVLKDALVGLMLLFALLGRSYVRLRYTHPATAVLIPAAATAHEAHGGGTTTMTRTDIGEPPTPPDVAGLRRSIGIETGLAVAVLVVTAFLVNSIPAKDAFAPPYTGKSTAGALTVAVDIYPAHKGLNGFHVYTVGTSGITQDVQGVTGFIQKKGGDKISVFPKHKSLGHYEDLNVVIPSKGTYTIDLQIQTSQFDSTETTQTFTVK